MSDWRWHYKSDVVKMSFQLGDPVYLALKRHKGSIVVGASGNAELANQNKLTNLQATRPRSREYLQYEQRKKRCLEELTVGKENSSPTQVP